MGLKKPASNKELNFVKSYRHTWAKETQTTTDDEIVEYYRTGEWKLETLIRMGVVVHCSECGWGYHTDDYCRKLKIKKMFETCLL